jgi:MoaA/NifB/PqqE/SkfB family radical SAM enzyme
MNKEQVFTSTGKKFIYHPEVIQKLITDKKATPISLQVAPTSQCNLKCSFCSNSNRDKHESLDSDTLVNFIDDMKYLGLKTIEWTGGGDPTMFDRLPDMINYCDILNLEQGLITNGLLLQQRLGKLVSKLKWVRISMNCLDYSDFVTLPSIKGTLGFSYVMNDKTTDDTLKRLNAHVRKYNPSYVRIVPDCQATFKKQEENNRTFSALVTKWGSPYFYQAKEFLKPKKCWWGHFKPFLLHNGWVYPCSSVVLNEDSNRTFHNNYKWFKMEDFVKHYSKEIKPFPNGSCNKCVFAPQNNMITSLLNPTGMENFV